MTLIVGLLCSDGVVVGSDSAVTFGDGGRFTIGQQQAEKVRVVENSLIYSSTGAVGISQVIAERVGNLWSQRTLTGKPEAVMDKVGKEIANLVSPYLQTGQFLRGMGNDPSASLCKSLIAVLISGQPQLFTFDFNGAPEKVTKEIGFVSLGSGQMIADPFLAFLRRILWEGKELTLSEGRLAAVWTIDHVRRTNPGGIGGEIQLATLSCDRNSRPVVTRVNSNEIQEHLQKIAAAEKALIHEIEGKSADGSVGAQQVNVPAGP